MVGDARQTKKTTNFLWESVGNIQQRKLSDRNLHSYMNQNIRSDLGEVVPLKDSMNEKVAFQQNMSWRWDWIILWDTGWTLSGQEDSNLRSCWAQSSEMIVEPTR